MKITFRNGLEIKITHADTQEERKRRKCNGMLIVVGWKKGMYQLFCYFKVKN